MSSHISEQESLGDVIAKTQASLAESNSNLERLEKEHQDALQNQKIAEAERERLFATTVQQAQELTEIKAENSNLKADRDNAQRGVAQARTQLEETTGALEQAQIEHRAAAKASSALIHQLRAELGRSQKALEELRLLAAAGGGEAAAVAAAVGAMVEAGGTAGTGAESAIVTAQVVEDYHPTEGRGSLSPDDYPTEGGGSLSPEDYPTEGPSSPTTDEKNNQKTPQRTKSGKLKM